MAGNSYFVRSSRPAREILSIVRERIKGVDPTLEQYHSGAMADFVSYALDHRRALVLFVGIFAGLALFLAVVGIYGVLSFEVAQRTREIGICSAIGASRGHVVAMVVRQGAWKIAAGLAAGVVGTFLLGRVITASLFGVTSHDPVTFGIAASAMFGAGLLACVAPALRASRIDPIIALRTY
jgi:putative ABC transport system permease protein